jgi:WD40 repeat protein
MVILGISSAGGLAVGLAQEKAHAPQAVSQGRTIDEWLAALKDRDPAVRRRAVEALGERTLDPAMPPGERSRLQLAVNSLMLSDKDPDVREAAGFFSTLQSIAGSPERVKQALEERRRVVRPTRTPIRLVDTAGRPVAGALAGSFLWRDVDREPSFQPASPQEGATSDARGELALMLEVPGHLDAAAVYAIRRDGDSSLVGLRRVTGEEIRGGRPVAVVLHPACRVRVRVECPGFRELEEKYRVDLRGGDWWRAAYVWLGTDHRSPRPLFTSSSRGELEFLLPPGRYLIMAYGSDVNNVERVIEVKPGHRVLGLGVLEVEPSESIKQGQFKGFWRSIGREPVAGPRPAPGGRGAEELVTFRRPRWGLLLKGETRQAQDVAFSPDGKLLATSHSYNADPGEVRLWDATTGANVATWTVAGRSVLTLAFSPDSKLLAGRVYPLVDPRSSIEVALWDVASRRELRTLGGPGVRIAAMAFSTDGRVLATCGSDRAVRLWDVASGRVSRRIDGMGPGRALAFSPDGKSLAMNGTGGALVVWDIVANRASATMEPAAEKFTVTSIAFAPDGRSLAACGSVPSADGQGQLGRARLYDLTQDPPVRRAQMVPDPRDPAGTDRNWISDIAFTPDGRRVVGVLMNTIVTWDAATGAERDSLERGMGGSADHLAVSPDGRWLAVTQPAGNGVGILDIGPTGP